MTNRKKPLPQKAPELNAPRPCGIAHDFDPEKHFQELKAKKRNNKI